MISTKRTKLKTTTTTYRSTLSPLDIPELLDHIFSFLDDNTLRHSVAPVCRQWYLLNHGQLTRRVNWHQTWSPSRRKEALHKLPGASRLRVYCPDKTLSSYRILHGMLESLEGFESEYQKQLEQRSRIEIEGAIKNNDSSADDKRSRRNKRIKHLLSTKSKPAPIPTLYDFTPLKELELFISHLKDDKIASLPFPPSLTSFTIKAWYSTFSLFRLDPILARCPLLEHICVEANETHGIWITYTPAHWRPPGSPLPHSRLQFRSLVLASVTFHQCLLEELVRLSPDLKWLELRTTRSEVSSSYDWPRLYRHLKANNISLNKAHFSSLGKPMPLMEMQQFLIDVYPKSAGQRLWALDVTPELLQSLFLQPGRVAATLTTLEIYWKPASKYSPRACCYRSLATAPGLIHQYLCGDDSPLVHLTTLKTVVRLEDLDIFQRAGYIDLDKDQDFSNMKRQQRIWALHGSPSTTLPSPTPSPTRVWRCRRLHTLHIEVHAPGQHRLQHPVHSRIIFGYVSRVCPLLEDLQICISHECQSRADGQFYRTRFNLRLDSGLCILGQLRRLQRLRVFSSDAADLECRECDLDWIVASRKGCAGSKKKRRKEVASWKMWDEYERHAEAACSLQRMEQASQQLGKATNNNNDDTNDSSSQLDSNQEVPEILGQLRNLGLLLDVEEMVKKMDGITHKKGEAPLLPVLKGVSFKYPMLLRPEDEFDQLFPSRFEKLPKWSNRK